MMKLVPNHAMSAPFSLVHEWRRSRCCARTASCSCWRWRLLSQERMHLYRCVCAGMHSLNHSAHSPICLCRCPATPELGATSSVLDPRSSSSSRTSTRLHSNASPSVLLGSAAPSECPLTPCELKRESQRHDAYAMPIVGSAVLVGLYLLYEHVDPGLVNSIISGYMALVAVGALGTTLVALYRLASSDPAMARMHQVRHVAPAHSLFADPKTAVDHRTFEGQGPVRQQRLVYDRTRACNRCKPLDGAVAALQASLDRRESFYLAYACSDTRSGPRRV